ncbi:hypothetical protein DFH07DRAFT_965414 [Mycena maculata]|uniref:BTB domain-containing protein n=1 Tax=Mycena maculata TaxID=230809 RepID=A0AAD7IEK4_9AGAR|nr:hypothetical protein DFH07DRAFT_965414 [Mycena maculata]
MDPKNNGPAGQAASIHDETYFFDDGDCTFLADGVTFKLHKWALRRDPNSAFHDMISIPQAKASESDLIPADDNKDEFRALCWVLYATPDETHLQTTREGDVQKLLNVAKMCHKYNLLLFETWALKVLVIQFEPPLDHLATCTHDELDRIMALACLCDYAELLRLVDAAWLSRLEAKQLRWGDALAAGEKYNRRKFQGEVYYLLNKQIHSNLASLAISPQLGFSDLGLTDKQLVRLLTGHAFLSNLWWRLRHEPLPRSPPCNEFSHGHYCQTDWSKVRSTLTTGPDMLAVLKSARNRLPVDKKCIENHLDVLIASAVTEKADYFLGVEITTLPTS